MMMINNNGAIKISAMLTILFLGLRLANYIYWSWYWVLSPILIYIILEITIASMIWLGSMVLEAFKDEVKIDDE
jgi:hypothetical protein